MFDFIRRLFGRQKPVNKQGKSQQLLPFSNSTDEKSSQAAWNEIWSTTIKADPCISHIDSKVLAEIEQHIKLGIIQGHGSRQAATELRPAFESIGLTRKDALNLVTIVTRLVQEKQISLEVNPECKEDVSETPEEIVRRARTEYVKIAKCFK